jgi:hypothetical protein
MDFLGAMDVLYIQACLFMFSKQWLNFNEIEILV